MQAVQENLLDQRVLRGAAVVLTAAALLAWAGGCGGDGGAAIDTGGSARAGDRAEQPQSGRQPGAAAVAPSRCPAGVPDCRSARGRIVFVEAVDPDGDGDAHFVIADPQGITLPGLTAIDVRRGLRPRPLPGVGDPISAAGPVQSGSYGQSQIHALELHVAGR